MLFVSYLKKLQTIQCHVPRIMSSPFCCAGPHGAVRGVHASRGDVDNEQVVPKPRPSSINSSQPCFATRCHAI
jgi:hypothetical protein